MSKKTTGIISLAIIALLFGGTIIFDVIYAEMTKHDITITVEKLDKTPTKNGDGSNYLVYTKEKTMVELQRAWYMWDSNIDLLYDEVEQKKGQQITLECYGWYFQEWYWYHMCHALK